MYKSLCCEVAIRNPERRRNLQNTGVDEMNINMNFKEIGYGHMDWVFFLPWMIIGYTTGLL